MKHFWTHKDEIPEEMGYGQFTRSHLFLLGLTLLGVISVVIGYVYADIALKVIILRTLGVTLILSDAIKMILIARSPVPLSEYLPLEICSFGAYFCLIDSFWLGNNIFPIMLLTLFLPAAIMAIIFPTTTPLPAFNFYTIHQFLYHGLIIAYVFARFFAKEIPLNYPGVWSSIFNVIILVAFMYVIDSIFDRNFMFLRDTYGNPLLQVIWDKTGGGFAYTVGLVAFCIFMIHVFYGIFKIIALLFL